MELTINIRGLEVLAEAIISLAGVLSQGVQPPQPQQAQDLPAQVGLQVPNYQSAPVPTAPVPTAPVPTAVPTGTNTYSIPQLQQACAPLVDAGRQGELVQLINSFGVQALTSIPLERLGEFATALRGMGAKI